MNPFIYHRFSQVPINCTYISIELTKLLRADGSIVCLLLFSMVKRWCLTRLKVLTTSSSRPWGDVKRIRINYCFNIQLIGIDVADLINRFEKLHSFNCRQKRKKSSFLIKENVKDVTLKYQGIV